MSGVLTFGQLCKVKLAWLAIAVAAWIVATCVSGRVGAVGLEVTSPVRLVALELRGHGWMQPALTAEEVLMLDAAGEHQRRVLAAALVGMALAAAGATLQALLRNALADPYILGISSGSAVGVAGWLVVPNILYQIFGWSLPLGWLAMSRGVPAVAGALLTCIAVFLLAQRRGAGASGMQPLTLLLVGVVVSSINAGILLLISSYDAGLRARLAAYMLGAISENDLTTVQMWMALGVFLVGYVPVMLSAAALNVGTLSDTQAISLGVNVQRLRTLCFVCASVMTAAAILLSGPIGFVGLICPHICRRLRWLGGGADHRTLLIAAPLCGAAFLMLADAVANAAITLRLGTLPVGVVTAFCGGPFFLYLLRRRAVGGG